MLEIPDIRTHHKAAHSIIFIEVHYLLLVPVISDVICCTHTQLLNYQPSQELKYININKASYFSLVIIRDKC